MLLLFGTSTISTKKLRRFSDGFCFLDIPQNETTPDMFKCDDYFEANNVTVTRGIKGLASGVIMDNIRNIIVLT
jgi:hypothetical protein